jgi:hypothetical protein
LGNGETRERLMAMRLIRLIDIDFESTALDGIAAASSIPRFVSETALAATRGRGAASGILSFNHSTFVT